MRISRLMLVLPALALVAATLFGGCNIPLPGPKVERVLLTEQYRADLRSRVAQYTEPPPNYKTLQQIEATSCRYLFWEEPATQEDAIDQLRFKAARLGANGILDVSCDGKRIFNLVKDCWSLVKCRGMAIDVGP